MQQLTAETQLDLDLNEETSSVFDYETQLSPQSTSTISTMSTASQSQGKKKRKGTQASSVDNEQAALLLRCEKILADEEKPKDALNVFGDYIVSQLRRFEGDELLQIETQTAIQKCLTDATTKYVAKKYLIVDTSGNLQPYNLSKSNENATSPSLLTSEGNFAAENTMDTQDLL